MSDLVRDAFYAGVYAALESCRSPSWVGRSQRIVTGAAQTTVAWSNAAHWTRYSAWVSSVVSMIEQGCRSPEQTRRAHCRPWSETCRLSVQSWGCSRKSWLMAEARRVPARCKLVRVRLWRAHAQGSARHVARSACLPHSVFAAQNSVHLGGQVRARVPLSQAALAQYTMCNLHVASFGQLPVHYDVLDVGYRYITTYWT